MKLNIGCSSVSGIYKDPEWVNMDKTPFDTRNFVQGDPLEGLKYEDNFFEEIHCIHVLEHIERTNHNKFLTELHRVTKPSGHIYVEVPDVIGVCQQVINAYRLQDWERVRCWILSIYGKGRWEGDTHRWAFHPESLLKTVEDAGFRYVVQQKEMISSHWKQEPVILVRGTK